jgi:hypothetical protein
MKTYVLTSHLRVEWHYTEFECLIQAIDMEHALEAAKSFVEQTYMESYVKKQTWVVTEQNFWHGDEVARMGSSDSWQVD